MFVCFCFRFAFSPTDAHMLGGGLHARSSFIVNFNWISFKYKSNRCGTFVCVFGRHVFEHTCNISG